MTRSPDYQKERRERQESRIINALQVEMTVHELVEAPCLSRSGVQKHLTKMISETPRRIHVARWQSTDGRPLAVYKKGGGRNAPVPRRTLPEIWAAIKADPIKHARIRACNQRSSRKRKGLPPVPIESANPFAALFTLTEGSHL
jgi:hypothetical protein